MSAYTLFYRLKDDTGLLTINEPALKARVNLIAGDCLELHMPEAIHERIQKNYPVIAMAEEQYHAWREEQRVQSAKLRALAEEQHLAEREAVKAKLKQLAAEEKWDEMIDTVLDWLG